MDFLTIISIINFIFCVVYLIMLWAKKEKKVQKFKEEESANIV